MAGTNKGINLLPPDLAGGVGGGKLLFVARSLAFSLSAALIVLLTFGIVGMYLMNRQLTLLSDKQTELKQAVRSLEKTESGMVLTRDRLAKVKKIIANRKIEDRFDKQQLIVGYTRDNIRFRESLLQDTESSITFESDSSLAVSDLFDSFFANDNFERLILNSLQFSPFLGYRFELSVF